MSPKRNTLAPKSLFSAFWSETDLCSAADYKNSKTRNKSFMHGKRRTSNLLFIYFFAHSGPPHNILWVLKDENALKWCGSEWLWIKVIVDEATLMPFLWFNGRSYRTVASKKHFHFPNTPWLFMILSSPAMCAMCCTCINAWCALSERVASRHLPAFSKVQKEEGWSGGGEIKSYNPPK